MPLILGTNSIKDTGYNVANSLRFNGDNFLSRTNPSATSTNDKKGTFSFWVKRASFPNGSQVLYHQADSSTKRFALQIANNDEFIFSIRNDAESVDIDGTTTLDRVYRDISAWTNFVFNYDTSGGTNGCKLFVNGTEQALTYSNTLPQNFVMQSNVSSFANHTIGRDSTQASNFWTGYMTEIMFVDGQQLAPTEFGEFDSDSPTIWKPKDISGINVGNLGYYLDFENSGALGTDAKGVGNFSTTNCAATDQSTDTCTNNFATLNPLFATQDPGTMSEGNTIYTASANAWGGSGSTIGLSQGKWYFEIQLNNNPGGHFFGVIDETANVNNNPHQRTGSTFFYSAGEMYRDGSSISSGHGTFGASDIGGVALNLDDNQITIYKNGSAIVTDFALSTTKNTLFVWVMGYNSGSDLVKVNFGGSPPFTISSGNTDGNGYGNFEYAVPSGYYSLNTKNLAEYG